MNKEKALDKIKNDIITKIYLKFPTLLYIGKTNDIGRRRKEHEKIDGLPNTVKLIEGSPDIISWLEEKLIESLAPIVGNKLKNESCNSSGNEIANILYLSLSEYHPEDDLCEYDEKFLLGLEYPLQIN